MDQMERIRQLFDEAISLPPDGRARLLGRLERSDTAIAKELNRLLVEDALHGTQAGFLPVVDTDDPDAPTLLADQSGERQAYRDPGDSVASGTGSHAMSGSRSMDVGLRDTRESGATARTGGTGPGAPPGSRTGPGTGPDRLHAPESSRVRLDMPADSPVVDHVRLEGMIGSGGLGRVYRGFERKRVVAVKVPRPDRLDDVYLMRWNDECSLAHELPPHPNLVGVHFLSAARYPDGTTVPALVMEYLPGAMDILTYADRRRLDRAARLALFEQACRGVSHLHERAVVHGDLKPSNLLVVETCDGPLVKVGDLGGTRTMLCHDIRTPQFTWSYASPEQIQEDPVKIGTQSDVYALGKVLTALLCGPEVTRLPPGTDRREYATWHPPAVSERLGLGDGILDDVLRIATAPAALNRYASAEKLKLAVRRCVTPLSQRALLTMGDWLNPPPSPQRWLIALWRRGVVLAAAAVTALACALATCNVNVLASSRPAMHVGAPTPTSFEHVALARIKDRAELEEIIARFGYDQVDPDRPVTVRHIWADVLRSLAKAGARTIAMDIVFPRTDIEELDAVIRKGVEDARAEGLTSVVVAIQAPYLEPGPTQIDPGLMQQVDDFGHIHVLKEVPGLGVGMLVVDRVGTTPRLPLARAAVAATHGRRARFQVHVDEVRSRLSVHGAYPPAFDIPIVRFFAYEPNRLQIASSTFIDGVLIGVAQNERVGLFTFDLPDDAAFEAVEIPIEMILDERREGELRHRVDGRIVVVATNANEAYRDIHEYRSATATPDAPVRSVPGPWFQVAAIETMMTTLPQPTVPAIRVGLPLGGLAVAVAWWSGAFARRRTVRRPDARQAVTRTSALTAMWGLLAIVIPLATVGVTATLFDSVSYLVAAMTLTVAFGLLLGFGLALRAAWSRRAQTANLRDVTSAW